MWLRCAECRLYSPFSIWMSVPALQISSIFHEQYFDSHALRGGVEPSLTEQGQAAPFPAYA